MSNEIFYADLKKLIEPYMPEFDPSCVPVFLRVISPHMSYASRRQHASQFSRNRTPLTRREADLVRSGLRDPEAFVKVLRDAVGIHRDYYGIKRNRSAQAPTPPMPVYTGGLKKEEIRRGY